VEVAGELEAKVALPPRVNDPPGTHWIGGWVGLRTAWTLWQRTHPCPCPESDVTGPAGYCAQWAWEDVRSLKIHFWISWIRRPILF
jgi:hypothetical protein